MGLSPRTLPRIGSASVEYPTVISQFPAATHIIVTGIVTATSVEAGRKSQVSRMVLRMNNDRGGARVEGAPPGRLHTERRAPCARCEAPPTTCGLKGGPRLAPFTGISSDFGTLPEIFPHAQCAKMGDSRPYFAHILAHPPRLPGAIDRCHALHPRQANHPGSEPSGFLLRGIFR